MILYRFSPIKDENHALKALDYIHNGLRKLSKLILEEELPINTLKLFAHYDEEYKFLLDWINSIGTHDYTSSSTSYYVKPHELKEIQSEPIEFIGLRVPDPYRGQVGCGDFIVKNYDFFKTKYLGRSNFIREIEHPTYEMLELFHPDVDVLGYIVRHYKDEASLDESKN